MRFRYLFHSTIPVIPHFSHVIVGFFLYLAVNDRYYRHCTYNFVCVLSFCRFLSSWVVFFALFSPTFPVSPIFNLIMVFVSSFQLLFLPLLLLLCFSHFAISIEWMAHTKAVWIYHLNRMCVSSYSFRHSKAKMEQKKNNNNKKTTKEKSNFHVQRATHTHIPNTYGIMIMAENITKYSRLDYGRRIRFS